MQSTDVLIVGAGPVGLTLAIECCRHQVNFRIVEHLPSRSDKSKALALWSGSLECLAAMGVVEEFLEAALPIKRIIFADHGKVLNEIPSSKGVDSPYPDPLILPQSHTEEILERRLESLGKKVERGVEFVSLSQEKESVTVELLNHAGERETLQVKYLAGCDGARSRIRHALPVQFEGETESLGFVLVDAKVEGDLSNDAMFASWGEGYTTIFFPVKEGVFRMFTQRKDRTNEAPPTLEEMQGYLHCTGLDRLRLYDPEWLSYFNINERVASRNRDGRVFLLGDAAHIHSPAGGQGMNTGMQDAFNLGWKLGLLLQGKGDPEMIAESYFQERHPIAETLVEETTKLLRLGVTNTPLVRLAKDFVIGVLLHFPALQHMFSGKLSEMNIHYPKSDLIEHGSSKDDARKDQVGWRVYDTMVLHAGTQESVSLWKEFLHPNHTLLLFTGKHPSKDTLQALKSLLENKSVVETKTLPRVISDGAVDDALGLGVTFVDPDYQAHQRFDISESGWLLVRPDLYVAARGTLQDTEGLEQYLKKVSGPYEN